MEFNDCSFVSLLYDSSTEVEEEEEEGGGGWVDFCLCRFGFLKLT
jgi:hypothetical protein